MFAARWNCSHKFFQMRKWKLRGKSEYLAVVTMFPEWLLSVS